MSRYRLTLKERIERLPKSVQATYLRDLTFGAEDSIVTLVGSLAGFATVSRDNRTVLIIGTILLLMQSFTAGTAGYFTEAQTEDYLNHGKRSTLRPVIGGAITMASYAIAGLVPIIWYVFLPLDVAIWFSAGASLVSLAALAIMAARLGRLPVLRTSLRLLIIGGAGVALGVTIGQLVANL